MSNHFQMNNFHNWSQNNTINFHRKLIKTEKENFDKFFKDCLNKGADENHPYVQEIKEHVLRSIKWSEDIIKDAERKLVFC